MRHEDILEGAKLAPRVEEPQSDARVIRISREIFAAEGS
jgi:hypothetical protein